MIALAKQKGVYDYLFQSKLSTDLDFSDHTFDRVGASSSLQFIMNPKNFFKEVFRVLSPGGLFVFTFDYSTRAKVGRLNRAAYFGHNPKHILQIAEEIGFRALNHSSHVLRNEPRRGRVQGGLISLQKPQNRDR